MNVTTAADRKRTYQLRVLTMGLVLGLASMIALFVGGLVTSTPGLVVAASTGAAALAGSFATAFTVARGTAQPAAAA